MVSRNQFNNHINYRISGKIISMHKQIYHFYQTWKSNQIYFIIVIFSCNSLYIQQPLSRPKHLFVEWKSSLTKHDKTVKS